MFEAFPRDTDLRTLMRHCIQQFHEGLPLPLMKFSRPFLHRATGPEATDVHKDFWNAVAAVTKGQELGSIERARAPNVPAFFDKKAGRSGREDEDSDSDVEAKPEKRSRTPAASARKVDTTQKSDPKEGDKKIEPAPVREATFKAGRGGNVAAQGTQRLPLLPPRAPYPNCLHCGIIIIRRIVVFERTTVCPPRRGWELR